MSGMSDFVSSTSSDRSASRERDEVDPAARHGMRRSGPRATGRHDHRCQASGDKPVHHRVHRVGLALAIPEVPVPDRQFGRSCRGRPGTARRQPGPASRCCPSRAGSAPLARHRHAPPAQPGSRPTRRRASRMILARSPAPARLAKAEDAVRHAAVLRRRAKLRQMPGHPRPPGGRSSAIGGQNRWHHERSQLRKLEFGATPEERRLEPIRMRLAAIEPARQSGGLEGTDRRRPGAKAARGRTDRKRRATRGRRRADRGTDAEPGLGEGPRFEAADPPGA